MQKYFLFIFLTIMLFSEQQAKAQIPVGTWRDHLPYFNTTNIVSANNRIYCSTPYSLFIYNLDDLSTSKLSYSNGLSDIGVSTINYDPDSKTLFVAYNNANLDLINGSEIINLNHIKNKQITGDKKIYQVVINNRLAYLACGFGIVVIDIDRKEVKETYYIGNNATTIDVYSIVFDNTYIYAATGSGIYRALKDNPILIDYNQWEKITDITFPNSKYTHLINYNSDIFACRNNNSISELYRLNAGNWELFYSPAIEIKNLKTFNNRLYVVEDNAISVFNSSLFTEEKIISYSFDNCDPNDVCITKDGTLYIGDRAYSLVKRPAGSNFSFYIPNSPYNIHVSDIDAQNKQLVVVGGGHNLYGGNLGHWGELYTFSNEAWNSNVLWSLPKALDFSKVLINPNNNSQVIVGAWGSGVYVFENGQLTANYNVQNSTLQNIGVCSNGDCIRTGGLLIDLNQNLYITNPGVAYPISVKTPEDKWFKYNYPGLFSGGDVDEIIETLDGNKWVKMALSDRLFVFNDNNTQEDTRDDNSKSFNVLDESGKATEVFSIVEDIDGALWVGTDAGVYTYYNPEEVFTSNPFYASRVKVTEKDNPENVQYLLHLEKINNIAIDGANRKWFATENSGVYLMSDDCETEIFHFTKENSKLLSNTVVTIGIEPKSGEVFFGTDLGVCSFKSTATSGDDNYAEAYVYPNPVRENYDGLITITGLAADVNVKITDIAGQIVYETKAFGGQAIWNGKNFAGQRVHTGVYLIFCTDEAGQKKKVLKLLFIN